MRARMLRYGAVAAVIALTMVTPLSGSARATCAGTSCPDGGPAILSFTVTAKLWIPFSTVADPMMPNPLSYAATESPPLRTADPNCGHGKLTGTYVAAAYKGDGHPGFAGSYRLIVSASFVFSGLIGNWKVVKKGAAPTAHVKLYVTKAGKPVASCTTTAKGTFKVASVVTLTGFSLVASGVLIPDLFGPPMSIDVTGAVSYLNPYGNAKIVLHIVSGNFPSSAVQVTGYQISPFPTTSATLLTVISNNASCLGGAGVLGLPGARTLLIGPLSPHTVDYTAQINKPGVSKSFPSQLCG
jgi:hypothetical protein